ncbi:putative mRNA-decapping enzyme subunit 1, PH-like domain superfamily [Helianthus annuus]|uniref:mRNA-decapping enzyme subunit 1, PH-like domain superfamily n=1 Tax=Helianthus annuus TaxID=4232 RepID=A0A9K3NTG5_HELAN|nr:putative mRNA-decapping enzyme subunit 1, PH-like domain superfamily [Helianthus annuus]KAJ0761815.1 putative mRNA-decapping enzyme subunit 1, PH-like domain superfamily [Helianthus annuus]KAJ0927488.1 putative mRNA-decapping enzyme subunit 1, PH-like domain superfamily [Helianthus annuus]KAJ0931909.1 putative mRNA-decapping enzyme subunit 1, PH-like domain superfamily [Helianthus annuus]
MSQTGKLMPNLDQNSTKILNLTVPQRMDPYIKEILITVAHVTFYEFNVDLNHWIVMVCKLISTIKPQDKAEPLDIETSNLIIKELAKENNEEKEM